MMSASWLLSITMFSVAMSGTPGPNNMMLTASGARYGYRRTLPHIAGVLGGCVVLFVAIALGLGAVFERYESVQWALRLAGSAYLLYLAWRIATAPPPNLDDAQAARPLNIWEAAAFQFANPKAWIMGLTLTASFLPANGSLMLNALLLALLMEAAAFPCISFWALFGRTLGSRLRSARSWRVFNVLMGALTAACVVLIFSD
jgi:threonine/homoserine/homoserine lactone efflux protein